MHIYLYDGPHSQAAAAAVAAAAIYWCCLEDECDLQYVVSILTGRSPYTRYTLDAIRCADRRKDRLWFPVLVLILTPTSDVLVVYAPPVGLGGLDKSCGVNLT